MSDQSRRELERLRAGERPSPSGDTTVARQEDATWRADVTRALLADVRPGDHALAIWLLEREIAWVNYADAPDLEILYRLIAAVARFARPDDALLIWRAAQATPETRAGVDVEQALRAGPNAALNALERRVARGGSVAAEAAGALAWMREGIASGAASDLPGYFTWADERFGLHTSGPT